MILGWHRAALRFLRKHRGDWRKIPLAVFVMAMSMTDMGETPGDGLDVYIDEELPQAPKTRGRLTLRERYANARNYVRPIRRAIHPARPASIGIFGGRLDYGRLKWWAVLFAMLIVQARAGDRRN